MAQSSAKALQSSLSKLQISNDSKALPKIRKAVPADSWEDEVEDNSSDTETESQATTPLQTTTSVDTPAPPPPTPSSPSMGSSYLVDSSSYRTYPPYGLDGALDSKSSSDSSSPTNKGGEEKRPEKSTAVASRLIAAGIGQKAPRRTKEQREYDQAMKIQEKKKRDQAKDDLKKKEEEKKQALNDVWGD